MFESVLVPLDRRNSANIHSRRRWLSAVSRVRLSTWSTLHVPYVPDHMLSNTQYQWEGLDIDEFDERHRVLEEEYLEGVAGRTSGLPTGGLPRRYSTDQPPEAIQRFADESKADLIVHHTTRSRERGASRER